jgi:hypothetical protein
VLTEWNSVLSAILHEGRIVRKPTGRFCVKLTLVAGWMGLLVMMVAAGQLASAQDDAKKTTHKNVRTLTGCLQKTDDANEYRLRTKDGGTWEVKSDSVKMAPHVGHTVTVTGVVPDAALHGLKEDTKTEAREHGINKGSTESGHLTATSLKMMSPSCSD